MKDFYTYAYLRKDGTPYYIGKGKGNRINLKGNRGWCPPAAEERKIYLKQNLTEEESFRHEIYMIAILGRKDLGTGILRNKTDGGEGTAGRVHSEETKKKLTKASKEIGKMVFRKRLGFFSDEYLNSKKCKENQLAGGQRAKILRGKPVIMTNIQTGEETTYQTMRDAAKSIGCASTHISGIIKGKRKTIKGYTARLLCYGK